MRKCLPFICILGILCSPSTRAEDPTLPRKISKIDGGWIEIGKFLKQEYSSKGILEKESLDTNGDGKFDQWIHFYSNGRVEKEFDLDFDGKIDRRDRSSKGETDNRLFLVEKKVGGKFIPYGAYREESRAQRGTSNSSSDCAHELSGENLERYLEIEKIVGAIKNNFKPSEKDGLLITDFGFAISPSCIAKYGEEKILANLRESILEGTACMLKNAKGPMAEITIQRLGSLLSNNKNPVKLYCDKSGCWDGTAALGSLPTSKDHPYIHLSPLYPYLDNSKHFKAIIFHELMHNCGYNHNHSVDLSTLCQYCCFQNNSGINANAIESACTICGGKYKEANDPEYIAELAKWAKYSPAEWNAPMIGIKAALTQIILSGKSQEIRRAFLQTISVKYPGIANELSEQEDYLNKENRENSFWNKIKTAVFSEDKVVSAVKYSPDRAMALVLIDLILADSSDAAESYIALLPGDKNNELMKLAKEKILEKIDGEIEWRKKFYLDQISRSYTRQLQSLREKVVNNAQPSESSDKKPEIISSKEDPEIKKTIPNNGCKLYWPENKDSSIAK